jgi:hypothetical protein
MNESRSGSRYSGLAKVAILCADGSQRVMAVPRMVPKAATGGRYKVHGEDRLDLMAAAAFGDSTLWWRLADANPWADATRVERPGQIIELPDA